MFCVNCGNPIKNDDLFCSKCGTKVQEDEIATAVVNPTPVVNPNPTPIPVQTPTVTEQSEPVCVETAPESVQSIPNFSQSVGISEPTPAPTPTYTPVSIPSSSNSKPKKATSVILSILLCLLIILTGLLGTVRFMLSEDRIEGYFEKLDLDSIEITDTASGEDISFYEFLKNQFNQSLVSQYGITESSIERIITETDLKDDIEEILSNYAGYFIDGDSFKSLEAEDIVDWFRENEYIIYEETGYQFTDADYIAMEVDFDDDILENFSKSGMRRALGIDPSLIQALLSNTAYIVLIALSVLCAITILIINRKHLSFAFSTIGVSLIVTGGIFVLLSIAVSCLILLINMEIVNVILIPLDSFIFLQSAVMLIVGIATIIIVKKIRRSKKYVL